MRILLVSAHFPPNFVSGGTLAADRQARGLLERGHDVSVYAGWYGTDRKALETLDEVVAGLPIRWITTEPFTGWADRANFDNRPVARDFAAHVARLRPDVVHFHSLQGLGARLLDVAADAGAAVVVTMHDFWWHCARQFLVTKDFQPCSLVVDCGVCPCEKTHGWLEKRNAWLAERLARADMMLAVSESAAQVFAANGVDPLRMRVDENGLPAAAPRTGGNSPPIGRAIASSSEGGRVRFTYTGGSARMKGVHVLVEAARRLRGLPGWELTLFGCEDFLRDERVALDGLPIESKPAFAPADAEAVFATTDVLVVPSVMRESHSLVTREALQRGVPVLVTDSLGPEEVVEHGVNGMVVPSADPEALAAAMRCLVDDADLLGALRGGASSPVVVRDIDDQLDGLERLFREVLERKAGAARPRKTREIRRVLFMVGIDGAPLRYRARLPAEGLQTLGVRSDVVHYRDPSVSRLAEQADAVVVYRVPATTQVLRLLEDLRRSGIPVFFDVDDLIFDPALAAEIPALDILPADEAELWLEGVRRYRTTMEACDAFIGTTEMLLGHASAVVGLPTYRFANGVGRLTAQASDAALARPRSPGPLRMGYFSGTTTHDHDWRYIEPAVVEVLHERQEVELWLGGHINPSAALGEFGRRVRRIPFTPWQQLPEVLRDLDVNLGPLAPDSRFNEAKSAIKWLEAALCETPTVASPTQPFREVIEDGANGLIATTRDDWSACLVSLLDDAPLRRRLGTRARRDALLRWSPHLQGRAYLEILESEIPARRPSVWTEAIALDEPPMVTSLEPYSPGARSRPSLDTERLRTIAARGRFATGRVARSLREDGAAMTARRAVRAARRAGRRLGAIARRL